MPLNRDWYDLNATRAYPLDTRATLTGDGGERLPADALADLSLRFPSTLGERVCLSALTVTDRLVTGVFLACSGPDATPVPFVPLAAFTVTKPFTRNRAVALKALYPGVAGWVVLGPAETPFVGRFSTPVQGLVLPRCARPYRVPPVPSVRKVGLATGLDGVVQLVGSGDLEVVAADRFVDGRTRKVILFRLKTTDAARNVLDLYRGPCGARPESGNCERPGVEFLNTVGPDCNGNVEIDFRGDAEVTPFEGGSEGLVLNHPIGLAEACTRIDRLPDAQGRLPNQYDDFCTSEYEGTALGSDEDQTGEGPPVFNIPDPVSSIFPCPPLPHLESFEDGEAESFRVLSGSFRVAEDLNESSGSSAGLTFGYAAEADNRRNVAVWDTCAVADAVGVRTSTQLQAFSGGPKTNGGLVLNYHTVGSRDEYTVAEIDLPTDSLRLRLWNGTSFVALGSVGGIGLVPGDRYTLEAETSAGPDPLTETQIDVTLTGVTDPGVTATLSVVTDRFLPGNGRFGLASDQARTRFRYFYIEEVP